jgi:hypothetical protein
MILEFIQHIESRTIHAIAIVVLPLLYITLITLVIARRAFGASKLWNYSTMAEASAADGKMKDLKISETKKKKDGNPQKAAKKPQQQKKKVRMRALDCLEDISRY